MSAVDVDGGAEIVIGVFAGGEESAEAILGGAVEAGEGGRGAGSELVEVEGEIDCAV